MNLLLIVVWLLVFAALGVAYYILLLNIRKAEQALTIVTIDPDQSCSNVSAQTLQQVTSNQCCQIGGITTPFMPVTIDNLEVLISPTAVYYQAACQGFCNQGVLGGNKPGCINDDGNAEYLACLAKIIPQNCSGLAMPVANAGSRTYYIQQATWDACPTTVPCV